ncbi:hypothetical protein NPIL_393801 [Nephila pilipes]|uniref:Uncharacterized protein n=1 Tax=Nephila pilipes TaxID=299642 RepID=A0A8X6UK12_NEPPI|nr:hypothetical protein NPIL_393801 [Nephila pilipes]
MQGVFLHVPAPHPSASQIPADLEEAVSELRVHPAVDNRVVGGVAHGQPMTDEPHVHDVLVLPDPLVLVPYYYEDVQGQPAQAEHCDDGYHHFHHLRRKSNNVD